ncbi:MAG: hypothetical protein GY794_18000, partial [bacterium]|nr:hypothetical protein [bacterium]
TDTTYEDRAFGGAGRDVLIANTGGDRLIDFTGEFNSYIVPFAPFGAFTISRAVQPQLMNFLYDLSESDGADPTRANDAGGDPARNGEPFGEIGLVRQQDADWQDQTGAPDDPQPGNIAGGKKDVLRSASFNQGSSLKAFAPDSGSFEIDSGRLSVAAASLGGDAVAVFHVGEYLPTYYEILATIQSDKPIQGWKANAYLIFDYHGPDDFKFAGVNISIDKIQMGHRDATGWHVDVQTPAKLKPNTDYNLLLAVNGVAVTLMVDNDEVFSYAFDPRVIDGYSYNLNTGWVGMGSENARGDFDNVQVKILAPEITLEETEDFSDGVADRFEDLMGAWTASPDAFGAAVDVGDDRAISLIDLDLDRGLLVNTLLELTAVIQTTGEAGIIYDLYAADDFKYVSLDVANDEVIFGHHTSRGGWVVDNAVAMTLNSQAHELTLSLKGTTVSVILDTQAVAGYVYNAPLVDGQFGALTRDSGATFTEYTLKTDDPAFEVEESNLVAAEAPETPVTGEALTDADLAPIVDEAIARLSAGLELGPAHMALLESVTFAIADLGGLLLGNTVDTLVTIDLDAAGHGWFVDNTLNNDVEFTLEPVPGKRVAEAGSNAFGRMDLMTVLTHELGHVIGIGHTDIEDVMNGSLETGTRYAFNEDTTKHVNPTHANNGQGNGEGNQNGPPVAADDSATTSAETPVTINVLANDVLGNGTTVIDSVTQGSNGSVTFDAAAGTATYTANAGFTGTDAFTYSMIDSNGDTSTATVTVEIEAGAPSTSTTTYTRTGGAVNLDDNGTITSTIEITDTFSILDLNIQLDISHSRDSDLDVFLVSASGTRIELFTDVGGNGDNFTNTILDDDAADSITSASAPFAGTYRPEGDLSLLEGELLNGIWTLEITDDRNGKSGTLNSWSLLVEHL